jgi:hypothetical protein
MRALCSCHARRRPVAEVDKLFRRHRSAGARLWSTAYGKASAPWARAHPLSTGTSGPSHAVSTASSFHAAAYHNSSGLEVIDLWRTGDRRPNRACEQWLNARVRKRR